MNIPATMFIEMAKDMLKHRDQRIIDAEIREFRGFGAGRLQATREDLVSGTPTQTPRYRDVTDAEAGYLLGLETMRAMIAGMPLAGEGVKNL